MGSTEIEGELGRRIKQKILDGEGKVSYAFGVKPILDACLNDLIRGQPELSPQTLRWLEFWFDFQLRRDVVNPLSWNKSNIGVKISKEPSK